MQSLGDDHDWARSLVADIPRPWGARLLAAWEKRRASFNVAKVTAEGVARRAANEQLRKDVSMLKPVSDELPLDASDADVCDHAWNMAERCRVQLLTIEKEQASAPTENLIDAVRAAGVDGDSAAPDRLDVYEQRERLSAICAGAGIPAPEKERYEEVPAVRRMVAAHWWRGRLRKVHGKARETAAIKLGIVRRDRECYASSVSVLDRQWQNERNAATLEGTKARNVETEQIFTLAELAAKGPANKAIRRAELMTRINGFERIAIAAGHAGLFLTITCPSKMHRMRTLGARTVENGKWDGTMPDEAQRYLAKVWARIRAALARRQVSLYGFRIAEPQHDGTPHWHCLFFYDQANDAAVRSTVRKYALAVDGDEPGAQAKRVDFKTMDPAVGTAAGYIAKYVAKNIDGYRLEKDLEGNDSLETSQRVEAWATRWRIRQFQQIGGPPVTVWRELRRVESVPTDAPKFVQAAFNAVNKVATFEGRDNASVAWDHYVAAQGGVDCGRSYRVRLATVPSDTVGRYGEAAAPRIVGVTYFEQYKVRDVIGNWIDVRPMQTIIESKRFTWEILRPAMHTQARAASANAQGARPGHWPWSVDGFEVPAERDLWLKGEQYGKWAAEHPGAAREWELGLKRAQRAPWTCVNNCTEGAKNGRASREAGRFDGVAGSERPGAFPPGDVREAHADRKSSSGEANRGGAAAGGSSRSTLMQ